MVAHGGGVREEVVASDSVPQGRVALDKSEGGVKDKSILPVFFGTVFLGGRPRLSDFRFPFRFGGCPALAFFARAGVGIACAEGG